MKNKIYRGKHAKKIHWMRIIMTLIIFVGAIMLPRIVHNLKEDFKILYNKIETKDKTIEEYRVQNDELNNQVNSLQNTINDLNGTINGLNEKVTTLETSKVEKQKKQVTSRGSSVSRSSTTNNDSTYLKFEATGYCSCSKCCGKSTGITASGTKATAGRTVAMSSKYRFGTKVEIQGLGTYTVEDRGGAIQGNRIDIYFNNHSEALSFGRRTVYLKVI